MTGPREELPALSEEDIAQIESENALRQFDAMRRLILQGIDEPFRMRPSMITTLNRIAVDRLRQDAGQYRTESIQISGSSHEPPAAEDVGRLVEELCDYVNDNWSATPIHLASYVMWRLNWVHPFGDGNGRTSRVVSYLVLSVRLGFELPGTTSIPARVAADKFPYYDALDAADAAWQRGQVDVSKMESLLSKHMASQLLDLYGAAGGAGIED